MTNCCEKATPPTICGSTCFKSVTIGTACIDEIIGPALVRDTFKYAVNAGTTGPVILSGEQTIDTIDLVEGDRVLVKDQVDPIENGIYIVHVGNWKRAPDMPTGSDAAGIAVVISKGAVNGATLWISDACVVGTDPIPFTAAADVAIDSTALTVTSNIFTDITVTSSPVAPGGTLTINIPDADPFSRGALTAADFVTFYSKLGSTLPDGDIFVGDGSNLAGNVTVSGDATLSNTGVLTLSNTGVVAGVYGSTTKSLQVVVDNDGRLSDIVDEDIAYPESLTSLNITGPRTWSVTPTVVAGAGIVYTAAILLGMQIQRSGLPGAVFDTLDTATAIIGAIPGVIAGQGFEFFVQNYDAASPITLVPGTGGVLDPLAPSLFVIAPLTVRRFLLIITTIGPDAYLVSDLGAAVA